MHRLAPLAALAVTWIASEVGAECCRLVKTDAETPSANVRACEPGPAHSCGAVLFTGTLAQGQDQQVCVAGDTLVYQELDPALGSYAPPIEARCNGGDVEL